MRNRALLILWSARRKQISCARMYRDVSTLRFFSAPHMCCTPSSDISFSSKGRGRLVIDLIRDFAPLSDPIGSP
jgi:hypothetical protein